MYNQYGGGYNQGPAVGRHSSNASRHSSQYGAPPPGRHSYQAPPSNYGPPGVPAGADPQLWGYFSAVDADGSQSIDVHELQAALVNGVWMRSLP